MTRFTGFPPEGLAFLADLAREQNRDWFTAHRAIYDRALQGPMTDLVLDLADRAAARGLPLRTDPKRSVFRIHRDVRFSRDKRPFKTNIGATLSSDGARLGFGVLYLHIDPAGSFAACGFYQPDPPDLDALRRAIADDPATWQATLAALTAGGLTLDPDETALRRPPRGFEGRTDPDLRRRSFITRRDLATETLHTPALVADIAGFAQAAAPLLQFGLRATGRD